MFKGFTAVLGVLKSSQDQANIIKILRNLCNIFMLYYMKVIVILRNQFFVTII